MVYYRQAKAGLATYDGVCGQVSSKSERNLWWRVNEDSEPILFSLRRDDVWRMVGAPADGLGLRLHT